VTTTHGGRAVIPGYALGSGNCRCGMTAGWLPRVTTGARPSGSLSHGGRESGGKPQTQQYFTSPAFSAAQQACKKLQPNQQITPAQRKAALKQLLQLARCMRAHGITNFPDPTTHGGGVGLSIGPNVDPDSPQFQAAQKACHMPRP
jgi:hypothetical protein